VFSLLDLADEIELGEIHAYYRQRGILAERRPMTPG
jgi:hypothetical protein